MELRLGQMVSASVMHTADCIGRHGDDVGAGVGDAGAGLGMWQGGRRIV